MELKSTPSLPETAKYAAPVVVFSGKADGDDSDLPALSHDLEDVAHPDETGYADGGFPEPVSPLSPMSVLFTERFKRGCKTTGTTTPHELLVGEEMDALPSTVDYQAIISASAVRSATRNIASVCSHVDNNVSAGHGSTPPVQITRRQTWGRRRSRSDCSSDRRTHNDYLQAPQRLLSRSPAQASGPSSQTSSSSQRMSPITPEALDASPANANLHMLVLPSNSTHKEPQSNLRNDFSAYVSGIGQPVDPDIELSSVVQLQTFRMHSRSRSVGPGDRHGENGFAGSVARAKGTRHRFYGNFSFRSARGVASPPRPPLALANDAFSIPMLPPAVAPAPNALANASVRSRSQTRNDKLAPVDAAPSISPRLMATRAQDAIPPLEDDSDAARTNTASRKDNGTDDAGFRVVHSRSQIKDARRRQRASRPCAEEPQPIDMSAFAERDRRLDERSRSSRDEPIEDRGRSRGRSRSRAPLQPKGEDRDGKRSGIGSLPANAARASAIGLSGSHRSVPQSPRRGRNRPTSYAAAAAVTQKNEIAQTKPIAGDRDNSPMAPLDVTAIGGPELPCAPTEASMSPAPPGAASSPTSGQEAAAYDNAQDLSRTRLLSNGGHLFMLSLEIAMMRNCKITAPLKPRWGKRRDDDFSPINAHPAMSQHRYEAAVWAPSEMSMTCAMPASLRNNTRTKLNGDDDSQERNRSTGGSPLKYAWTS